MIACAEEGSKTSLAIAPLQGISCNLAYLALKVRCLSAASRVPSTLYLDHRYEAFLL